MQIPAHGDECVKVLKCRHCIGSNCKDYVMPCHIEKDMGNGRLKIWVFGDRYWKHSLDVKKVRYVSDYLVIDRPKNQ